MITFLLLLTWYFLPNRLRTTVLEDSVVSCTLITITLDALVQVTLILLVFAVTI